MDSEPGKESFEKWCRIALISLDDNLTNNMSLDDIVNYLANNIDECQNDLEEEQPIIRLLATGVRHISNSLTDLDVFVDYAGSYNYYTAWRNHLQMQQA